MKIEKDKFLLFSLFLFTFLLIPFLNSIPHLDGNIDFVECYHFFRDGIYYFKNWYSIHPPFKTFFVNVFWRIFGINTVIYNLIGLFFGLLGIFFFYKLMKNLFDRQTAQFASLFLAIAPLFLSNALSSTRDYLLTILIIIALYFYFQKRFFLYVIFGSLVVLTKETGLILVISALGVEALYWLKNFLAKRKTGKKIEIFLCFIPIFVFLGWLLFLKKVESRPWSDHIHFEETRDKGSFYTVFYVLSRLKIFNLYATSHFRQLFLLNFNWVYWIILFIGLFAFLVKRKNQIAIIQALKEGFPKTRTLLAIAIFLAIYFFTVLTFPTYTIPRYALPFIPFLFGGVSVVINKEEKRKNKVIPIIGNLFIFSLLFISLFSSIDPISSKVWGKMNFYGENLYDLVGNWAGYDGMTYNLQYLFIVKKRTNDIREIESQKRIFKEETDWQIFLDPNNDCQTFRVLNFNILASHDVCKRE